VAGETADAAGVVAEGAVADSMVVLGVAAVAVGAALACPNIFAIRLVNIPISVKVRFRGSLRMYPYLFVAHLPCISIPIPQQKRTKDEANVMKVGESVVLVRDVDGVEVGTHGRVKDTNADKVVIECKMREHSAFVLTHMWDVLPERLWDRLTTRRAKHK
jgi:hypothetical protein